MLRVLAFLLLLHVAASVDVKLLTPVKNGTFDVAVIVTPGAEIPGDAYRPLGKPGFFWLRNYRIHV